jgi:LacI family transcriptional regulator
MSITVNQIAEICGVSRTTVIRALNGQDRVSQATRKRIVSVAEKHGYRPNLLARSLHKGRTMSIGILTLDIENYVFAQSLGDINHEAEKRGYFLHIVLQGQDREAEVRRVQELADRRVEGILINPIGYGEDFKDFLIKLGIPIVCIGNYVTDEISTVMIDEYRAARDAVCYIAEKNYERIIFLCPPLSYSDEQNIYSHLKRLEGIEDEVGKRENICLDIIGVDNFYEELEKSIDGKKKKTAILCSGDIYALKVMSWLKEKNMQVPYDIGVMGFDDISILKYITPALTTVSTNIAEVSSAAVAELIGKIEHPDSAPKQIYLNHSIVVGETI